MTITYDYLINLENDALNRLCDEYTAIWQTDDKNKQAYWVASTCYHIMQDRKQGFGYYED